MNTLVTSFITVLILGTLSACSSLPAVKPDPANSIRSIALMPLVNNTIDIEGPTLVRALLAARLEGGYFYKISPLDETDRILREQMGITLGSQLDMATIALLCEKLGTDAILQGSLEDFSQKITGLYNNKRVRLRVKLDSCKGGTIWKNGIGVKREVMASDNMLKNVPILGNAITSVGVASAVMSSISDKNGADLPPFRGEAITAPWQDISEGGSSAELNLIFGIGERVTTKALNNPLLAESEVAIDILLRGIYDDGSDYIPYGKMIPAGPVTPKVTKTAESVKK